jgi:lipopolysaccharide transport system ATP-binding protein
MPDIAIRVEHLSKQYWIGGPREAYRTLGATLTDALAAPLRRARTLLRGHAAGAAELYEPMWALRDASFEIKSGEIVGIIGRNGAGKSTLLKILSRITEPTSGAADIHGRVGSLLEVGTGFHQELTGRENIYLNGAILGMKRAEIARKFDEIVKFAEVERFLDTPVKHYSSGMYLRLAFAVAAHLEPEILLVDEVLAVGDANFQKKCLNKMQEVGQSGRTVLFVSHNMSAVTRLCERVILLSGGKVERDGPAHEVVSGYLQSQLGTTAAREWADPARAPGGPVARLRAVRVRGRDGRITDSVDIRQPISIEMEYDVLTPGYAMFSHIQIFNEEGIHAFSAHDVNPAWRRRPRPVGRWISKAWIPGNLLAEGTMLVGVGVVTHSPDINQFYQREVIAFRVVDSLAGDSARGDWAGNMGGVVRPLLEWTTDMVSEGVGAVSASRS